MDELHIHPTKRCNSNCSFCSYRGNHTGEQLPPDFICEVLREGKDIGYTKLRIAGGGEPTIYKDIFTVLCTARYYRYDISLQTNGTNLLPSYRQFCKDIRVSLGDRIKFKSEKLATIPDGYNYVVTSTPDYVSLNNVIRYAIANNQYIRIVTDETDTLNTPTIADIKTHIPEHSLITFHDGKAYHNGNKHCPSNARLLGADGFWYPCCRTQYSKGKNLTDYDETMRLGKQYDRLSVVTNIKYNGRKCKRCYYSV